MEHNFVNPVTTRSRVVLEIASELVAANETLRQAKVMLRAQGSPGWSRADLAIINPSAALTLAYRGTGQYAAPQPVRALAVIPSLDQYVFAVKSSTGLTTFEDIATRRAPLRVALRGQRDHCLHAMLDHIAAAAGFTLADLAAWGGEARREGPLPWPDGAKFQALARGEIDAIFDEAAPVWVNQALAAGMTILPLAETTVRKLEAMGYRRAVISRDVFPALPRDVLTIDFSGWPIFVRADAPDLLVRQICAALDAGGPVNGE